MDRVLSWPLGWETLLLLPGLLVGFTVHELAHALVAYMLGDTSQVERSRLSFNPLRHVSWVGLIAFLLVRVGWAKPVWVDHTRFRIKNRALGMFLVSIAGAAANLLTALIALAGMAGAVMVVWLLAGASPLETMAYFTDSEPGLTLHGLVVALTNHMVMVNLLLAFFNLLPLPPLDGFQAAMSLWVLVRTALRGGAGLQPPAGLSASVATSGEAAQSPSQIHLSIGLEYHKEGQMDEAIVRYRQAIAHDERLGLAYYNQGLAYWAKGRIDLAGSAFRAAAQCQDDPGVRSQAELRLRDLARIEQNPHSRHPPLPPPLEPGEVAEEPAEVVAELDPGVARRVWQRLALGSVVVFFLTIMLWLVVTGVTLQAMMSG